MNQYLSSIGFKKYINIKSIDEMIDLVILDPSKKYISNFGKEVLIVEFIKYFGDNIGVHIFGELDDFEEVAINRVIPYVKGQYLTENNEIKIINSKNKYQYMFEDINTGIEIIFNLQNVIDVFNVSSYKENLYRGVKLIGYSIVGNVILPISKDEVEILLEEEEEKYRSELVKAAKNGDKEAFELLELEEEETVQIIKERLETEDLLSIIDEFFMPYDEKTEKYAILGTIFSVNSITNNFTGEKVYLIGIKCLGLKLEICINKEDLIGIPQIGRRFKGIIWLHGYIEYKF